MTIAPPSPLTVENMLGQPSFLTVAGTNGAVITTDGMTVEEAIKAAGLDFHVQRVRLQGLVPMEGGGYERVDWSPFVGTARTNTDGTSSPLGVVLGNYKVCQNAESFYLCQELVDEYGANIVGAGQLGQPLGSRTFVAVELKDPASFGLDPATYRLFVVVTNSHDGESSIKVNVTLWHIAAATELWAPMPNARQEWTIRHSGDLATKMDDAVSTMEQVRVWTEAFGDLAWRLQSQPMTIDQMRELCAYLLPTPPTVGARGAENWASRRVTLLKLFLESCASPGTKLAALLAVNRWVGHHQGSQRRGAETARAARIASRPGQPLKIAALTWLTDH